VKKLGETALAEAEKCKMNWDIEECQGILVPYDYGDVREGLRRYSLSEARKCREPEATALRMRISDSEGKAECIRRQAGAKYNRKAATGGVRMETEECDGPGGMEDAANTTTHNVC